MCRTIRHRSAFLAILLVLLGRDVALAYYNCDVCTATIEVTSYSWLDKVTNTKKRLCYKCIELPDNCTVCSLPVFKTFTKLPDGRAYCERDAKTVVFEDSEAQQICEQTRDTLDRLFSRFLTFPQENITITLVDRINLITLFNIPGRDFECPNVQGYIQSRTNRSRMEHDISLMSGLSRGALKSTYAHECTHAWVAENVPPARRKLLKRDAEEGFCELVAYMLADSQGDEDTKKIIELNGYTRGQFGVFREAERQFGFNDVMEWMKHGVDDRLWEDDLVRVRVVETPKNTQVQNGIPPATKAAPTAGFSKTPTRLVLNGIMWSKTHPTALINNRNFFLQDQVNIRLGTNTLTIRCLSIQTNSVWVQNVGTGEKIELMMERAGNRP